MLAEDDMIVHESSVGLKKLVGVDEVSGLADGPDPSAAISTNECSESWLKEVGFEPFHQGVKSSHHALNISGYSDELRIALAGASCQVSCVHFSHDLRPILNREMFVSLEVQSIISISH
jgi:hypothetical protein